MDGLSYETTRCPGMDVPLLRKAVEWVEVEAAKPISQRSWDQRWWAVPNSLDGVPELIGTWHELIRESHEDYCGTVYCIAGWIVQETLGEQVVLEIYDEAAAHPEDDAFRFPALACMALGIPYSLHVERLFRDDNSAEDVRFWADALVRYHTSQKERL